MDYVKSGEAHLKEMTSKVRILADINIKAPLVQIPLRMDEPDSPSIFVHLGTMSLKSNLAEQFLGDVRECEDIHSIYDMYYFVLSGMKVYLFWPDAGAAYRQS